MLILIVVLLPVKSGPLARVARRGASRGERGRSKVHPALVPSKRFGGLEELRDVSLALHEGRPRRSSVPTVGTTLFNCAAGADRPTSGRVPPRF